MRPGDAGPRSASPGFAGEPKPAQRRAVARPTKGPLNRTPRRCAHRPWVELRSTPLFLDSPRSPSRRSVEPSLDPRRALSTGRLDVGHIPRGSSSARRPHSWIRRGAQAGAASSRRSTHEGPSQPDASTLCTSPWVELRSTPAFLDSPRSPSQRCVALSLDPRRTLSTGRLDAGHIARGSSSARRLCSWIRRGAQANAASLCRSTHEGPSQPDASTLGTSPVGRAPLDASVPGFAEVPKPTQRRAVARPTKDPLNRTPRRWAHPPWVELRSTPAFLDSPRCPSQRSVALSLDPRRTLSTGRLDAGHIARGSSSARRLCSWIRRGAQAGAASSRRSTHEGPSQPDASTLCTSPVGRAPLDASVPGFAEVPKPTQRRAAARFTRRNPAPPRTATRLSPSYPTRLYTSANRTMSSSPR